MDHYQNGLLCPVYQQSSFRKLIEKRDSIHNRKGRKKGRGAKERGRKKSESLFTDGGNVKWCGYCGKQSGSSSVS